MCNLQDIKKGDLRMGQLNINGMNGVQKSQVVNQKSVNAGYQDKIDDLFYGSRFKNKKEIVKMNADGTYTKKTYINGILNKETVYKTDKNGKEKLTSVTNHYYKVDDSGKEIHTSKEFIDEDGDGYNDVILTKKYENGRLVGEEKYFEEDIEKDIKNKPWNKHNRLMKSHDSGIYVM